MFFICTCLTDMYKFRQFRPVDSRLGIRCHPKGIITLICGLLISSFVCFPFTGCIFYSPACTARKTQLADCEDIFTEVQIQWALKMCLWNESFTCSCRGTGKNRSSAAQTFHFRYSYVERTVICFLSKTQLHYLVGSIRWIYKSISWKLIYFLHLTAK